MKTVEELETVLEKVRKDLEELKKSKNGFELTPKGWMPKHGETYWIAHYNLNPTAFICDERGIDKNIIKYNRIFKTKKECELYCDIQRAFRDASRKFVEGENNYYISYYSPFKEIKINIHQFNNNGILYFDSKETIQNLIDKFGEENIKRYYLGVC